MTCSPHRSPTRSNTGFTLIEVVVVLAVIGILLGTAMPLAGALVDADKRQETRRELAEIGDALEAYYFDNAAFPTALSATGFVGVYLQSGVGNSTIRDNWGGDFEYGYQVATRANTASVWSRGENGVDDGLANEEFAITVAGATPGLRKTRLRMRIIVHALANHLEAGNSVSGTWTTDRAAMGLGYEYQTDGFGNAFQLDAATLVLRSAGPDGVMSNSDDLTS